MARAVWTGSLAFGLVTIPVRLFPATEPKDVRFHLVDERGRRVRYRRSLEEEPWETPVEVTRAAGDEHASGATSTESGPADGEERATRDTGLGTEVAYEDLKRGYETPEGSIVLDPEEIAALQPERSRVIEVEDFVRLADVDPVFFEKSYVLAPQDAAGKPYALLQRALEEAGRVGIGRFVLRTKPHLVAIRPTLGVLGLETLFFGDEVREPRSLVPRLADVEISERELELADRLIGMLETDWDPSRYADTYRDELLQKIAEKEPTATQRGDESSIGQTGRVEELMEALQASVEEAKATRGSRSNKRSA